MCARTSTSTCVHSFESRPSRTDSSNNSSLNFAIPSHDPLTKAGFAHSRTPLSAQYRYLVEVSGSTIIATGPNASIPTGAQVIDFGDTTLSPGFIDAHTHL